MYLYTGGVVTRGLNISLIAMVDPGDGPRGPAPTPLFVDQNEAQRAEKIFGGPDLPLDSICNI